MVTESGVERRGVANESGMERGLPRSKAIRQITISAIATAIGRLPEACTYAGSGEVFVKVKVALRMKEAS